MNSKTILISHGEKTNDGRELTKREIAKAEYLAKYLKKEKVTKIISSNQNRAIQTVGIINKVLKVKHTKDPKIREIYFPSKKGRKYQKERNKIKEFYEKVKMKNKENILVVAHGKIKVGKNKYYEAKLFCKIELDYLEFAFTNKDIIRRYWK